MSEDITYCIAYCGNKDDCERNPSRIKNYLDYHSFADLSDVCDRYKDAEGEEESHE